MIFLLLLTACEISIEEYLRDVQEPAEEIQWDGYVYWVGPVSGESDALDQATVTLSDLEETWTLTAEQPFSAFPGFWRFDDVPVCSEVVLRVEGESTVPMIWRDRAPDGDSRWSALYTMDLEEVDSYFSDITATSMQSVEPLAEGNVAHLWGSTWEPETWVDAELIVIDAVGDEHPVLAFHTDEETEALVESEPGDPIDVFYAFNLPEGQTTLIATSADGQSVQVDWPTRGGDLLSALYTLLPESP